MPDDRAPPREETTEAPGPDGPYHAITDLKRDLVALLESVLERRCAVNAKLRDALAGDEGHELAMILRFFETGAHAPVRQRLLDAYCTDRYPKRVSVPPKPITPIWVGNPAPGEDEDDEPTNPGTPRALARPENPTNPGTPRALERAVRKSGPVPTSPTPEVSAQAFGGDAEWPTAREILESMAPPGKKSK